MAELPNAQAPILVLPTKATNIQLLCAAALAGYLQTDGKKLIILSTNATDTQKLRSLVSEVEIVDTFPQIQYVLTLKSPAAEVEAIKWEQVEGQIKIHVTLTSGKLASENVQLTPPGRKFDLLVLLGTKELTDLGAIYTAHKEYYQAHPIFVIGSEVNLSEDYEYTTSNLDRLSTLGEQVLETLNLQKLTPKAAQMLMTAIFLETDYLKLGVKSSAIFLNLKKLADSGANSFDCAQIISSLTSLTNAQGG